MPLFIVTVRETGGRSREWEERVRADHAAAAVGRAVRKLFGARASLHQDHGLPAGYGQIVRSVRRHRCCPFDCGGTRPGELWSATCVTGRVAVDVAPVRRGGAS